MRDGIILTVADDGTARVYYDTYDIVIHCESQEWRDKVKERIMGIKPKTTGSGFNHGEKDENWEARTTAEPSASDCWSNDNRPTNDSIVTKSSRYSTDRITDDTISRQAAIDALFGLYEYQRDIDPTEAADLVRQGIYLAEKKIDQLPSAQPETQWISCRAKEPAGGLNCWFTANNCYGYRYVEKGVFTNRYGRQMEKGFITTHGHFVRWESVLAWMPIVMPEPWEGENDG